MALSGDNIGEVQTDSLIWGVNELISLYLMDGDAPGQQSSPFFAPAIAIYKELSLVEPDPVITMHLVELLLESENFDQSSLLVIEDMHSEMENDIKGRKLLLKVYLGNGDRESVEKLLDSECDFFKDDDILAPYASLATSIGYMNAQMRLYLYNDALFALAGRVEERRDLLQAGVKLLLDLGQQNMAERVLRQCWSGCVGPCGLLIC